MKVLFDLGHPAHVHLFRHLIGELRSGGHRVYVASRDKDVALPLLDHYDIEHECLSRASRGKPAMLAELFRRTARLWLWHRRVGFDAAFGTSVSIGFLTLLAGVPSYNVNEDDDDTVPLYAWLGYPFATAIVNPDCVAYRRWGRRRVKHASYHELAYLHPNRFSADPKVLGRYGLSPRGYVLLRFSALEAHHDADARGISPELAEHLTAACAGHTIVRSVEGNATHDIAPWDMHQVLSGARLIVSDSQTMTIEGAVLGVPTVRINSFVGRSTVIDELEKRYRLALGFRPDQEEDVLAAVAGLLSDPSTESIWRERRARLLTEKVDLREWLLDFFEREVAQSSA